MPTEVLTEMIAEDVHDFTATSGDTHDFHVTEKNIVYFQFSFMFTILLRSTNYSVTIINYFLLNKQFLMQLNFDPT